jgi:hypothetical protein
LGIAIAYPKAPVAERPQNQDVTGFFADSVYTDVDKPAFGVNQKILARLTGLSRVENMT